MNLKKENNAQDIKYSEIGELIKRFIILEADKTTLGLTNFIKQIAKNTGLSSRQIYRITTQSDFPEAKAVLNVSKGIQNVGLFDPSTLANRLLWPPTLALDQLHEPGFESKTEIKIISRDISCGYFDSEELFRGLYKEVKKGNGVEFLSASNFVSSEELSKFLKGIRRKMRLTESVYNCENNEDNNLINDSSIESRLVNLEMTQNHFEVFQGSSAIVKKETTPQDTTIYSSIRQYRGILLKIPVPKFNLIS